MEKIIDIEERIPSLRQRRKRRITFTFSILLFLFFTALFLVLYLQSSWSKIQLLSVEGNEFAEDQELISQSTLVIGDSLWAFRKSEIESLLEQHSAVEAATVKRKDWTTVELMITEFEVVGYRNADDHMLVLSNGEEIRSEHSGSLIGPALHPFTNKKVETKVISELASVKKMGRSLISEITSTPSESDPYLITVYMNDGNTIIASAMNFAENLNYYPSVLQQIPEDQKGVVDMEVGVFFTSYENLYSGEGEELSIEEEEAPE